MGERTPASEEAEVEHTTVEGMTVSSGMEGA